MKVLNINRRITFFLSLIACCFSPQIIADTLKVAVGLALPPYVLSSSNTGIELDIVREVLKTQGHQIKPVYLPFGRVGASLDEKTVDAALTVTEASGLNNVYFSESHVTYQNVAVSLAKNNYTISVVKDLSNYSIIAFQHATKYLGDDFARMAANNKKYSEKAKQSKQITMLFAERINTVVMDINIFKYFRSEEKKVDTSASVSFHEIFPPSHYKVGFLSKKYRDQFNDGLAAIKASGKYNEIINNYIQ